VHVHQVLVGATPHDAITNMARRIRGALRHLGPSEIYTAGSVGRVPDIKALSSFPSAGESGVIVFHASFGSPEVFSFLLERPEPIVMVFHNLSPVEEFELSAPATAAMLLWGRREIELLRDRVALVVADSPENARELEALGYRDVIVVPAGVDGGRLGRIEPDPSAVATMRTDATSPLLLFVGQIIAHKRIDVLLHMQLLLHRYGVDSTLALVGPPTDGVLDWVIRQETHDLRIPRVMVLGSLGDDALAAVMSRADVFVTASEHEGLCLPAIEAMAMGIPVVGRRATALVDTVGDAGLLLDADAGPAEFAEAIVELDRNPRLATLLGERGRARAGDFELDRNLAAFVDALAEVI
jgi:glycosyltransferase involved in cell wall biosynthesis